jgi:hypothetical protein
MIICVKNVQQVLQKIVFIVKSRAVESVHKSSDSDSDSDSSIFKTPAPTSS